MSVPRIKLYALIALLLFIGLVMPGAPVFGAAPQVQAQPVVLYFFWGEGCPACAAQKPFLEELAQRHDHLEIRSYEVYHSAENLALLVEMAAAVGFTASAVPTTIIGERHWVGYSDAIAQQIESEVIDCGVSGCIDVGAALESVPVEPTPVPATPTPEPAGEPDREPLSAIPAPNEELVGEGDPNGQAEDALPVALYFFWGVGCPYCEQQKPFLEELREQHPNLVVHSYEVYHVLEHRILLQEMAAAAGFEVRGVPVTFVGDRYWVGYSEPIAQQIRSQVQECGVEDCVDPGAGFVLADGTLAPVPTPTPVPPRQEEPEPVADEPWRQDILTIPLLGTIDLGAQSLALSTALIAFMDGFNPCSLWVVSILISLVLRTGSRKRVLLIGASFLSVTALIYALFIAGLFTVFAFIGYMGWIQIIVAMIALFFAAVNIKDYFWYKEGLSLTIADEQKPGLYRRMRRILRAESLGSMILATVVMAAGAAIVELPCTAGFPMIWSNLVATQGVGGLSFGLLLGLYIVMYLLIEAVLFVGAIVTLRSSKLQETHGRVLKLFGGTLMLTLAMVMFVDPNLMSDISSTLIIFGAAILVSLVALMMHRLLLPLFGVYIGTELEARRK